MNNPTFKSLVPLACVIVVALLIFAPISFYLAGNKLEQNKLKQSPLKQDTYTPPTEEEWQRIQEKNAQQATQKLEEETKQLLKQIADEKENAIYKIYFIQIDRELDFRFYVLEHRLTSNQYLLVTTPQGSSVTPLPEADKYPTK